MSKNKVEICANCGKVSKTESVEFLCTECGSEVSVVVSRQIFKQMVDAGAAKE